MRAAALFLVLLLVPAGFPAASAGTTTVACGNIAPFGLRCEAHGLTWTGTEVFEAKPHLGTLEVVAVYIAPDGGELRRGMRCSFPDLGHALGGCASVMEPANVAIPVGAPIVLRCTFSGTPQWWSPVPLTVGPWGPWSCALHQD